MEPPHPDPVAHIMHFFATLRTQERGGSETVPRQPWPAGIVPMLPDQWSYVVDYRTGQLLYAQGFQRALGYRDEDVDLEFIFRYVHPDDLPVVTRVVERAMRCMYLADHKPGPFESVMSMDYRVRKANGTYIKMLRQVTVFGLDENQGSARSTLSLCKDISNIKSSDQIGWQSTGPGTEKMDMADILQAYGNLVYRPTAREMDVMRKMAEGKNSQRIGQELFISVHTVNAHRRNLLKRTGLRNSAELMRKATEQGWV